MKRFSHPGTVHTYGFSPGQEGNGAVISYVCFYSYSFIYAGKRTSRNINTLTSVNSHVVLVVGGTSEGSSTARLRAVVRPLTGVCTDVDFTDVGSGKRPATAFHWAFKGLLSCRTGDREAKVQGFKH